MQLSTLIILIFIVCVILFCAVYMHEEDDPVIIEYTHTKEVKVPVVKTVYVDRPVEVNPTAPPVTTEVSSLNNDDIVDKIV